MTKIFTDTIKNASTESFEMTTPDGKTARSYGVRVPRDWVLGKPGEGFNQLLKGLDTDRFWGRFYKAPFLRRILGLLVDYVNAAMPGDSVARRRLGGRRSAHSRAGSEANRQDPVPQGAGCRHDLDRSSLPFFGGGKRPRRALE